MLKEAESKPQHPNNASIRQTLAERPQALLRLFWAGDTFVAPRAQSHEQPLLLLSVFRRATARLLPLAVLQKEWRQQCVCVCVCVGDIT